MKEYEFYLELDPVEFYRPMHHFTYGVGIPILRMYPPPATVKAWKLEPWSGDLADVIPILEKYPNGA